MDFEVVVSLPIYPRKYANHNKNLLGWQMMKVLARPTNNSNERFCRERKGGKFKSEYFAEFSPSLREIFGLCRTNL